MPNNLICSDRNLWEPPNRRYFVVEEYNEVVELVLAMGLFLFMTFQLKRIKAGIHAGKSTVGAPRWARFALTHLV